MCFYEVCNVMLLFPSRQVMRVGGHLKSLSSAQNGLLELYAFVEKLHCALVNLVWFCYTTMFIMNHYLFRLRFALFIWLLGYNKEAIV